MALSIREQKAPDSLDLAGTYNNLGAVFDRQKQWGESLRYYKKALAIREQKAPDSLVLAYTYNSLGRVLCNQNKTSDARRLYGKALAIIDCQDPQDPIRSVIQESLNKSLKSALPLDVIDVTRTKLRRAISTSTAAEPIELPVEYIDLVTTKDELGSGYFGVVWKGFDSELSMSFAVKIIHDDILQQRNTKDIMNARKSFEQEIEVSTLRFPVCFSVPYQICI
jgi:tetratricopeptide (TPR) repeat protein